MAETKLDAPRPDKSVDKPKVESKDDHVAHIAELAQSLTSATPSGAETVRDKILMHIAAIQDPAAHNERIAAERKAEEAVEAQRAKERAELKTKPAEKAKPNA
jgi:hypothetical protein